MSADINSTSLFTAMANVAAGVQSQVAQLNAALQADYLVSFNNWAERVIAAQAPDANPPQPPNGYVVGYFTDPRKSEAQWAYPVIGTVPVCAMPPLPVPPQQAPVSQPSTGEPQIGSKQNVPIGDTMPVGVQITDANGGVWQKMASATPFGTAYYYERVA